MSYPQAIYIQVHGKLHRGWRDESGLFTLEQCNLDQSHVDGEVDEERLGEFDDRCQNCFPN